MYEMLGSLEKVGKMQKVFKASAGEIKDKHAAFLFFFGLFFFSFSVHLFFVHHPLYFSSRTLRLSSCLSVSKASRRTHPGGPRRSWQWGSCCGCRQPRRPRSGC